MAVSPTPIVRSSSARCPSRISNRRRPSSRHLLHVCATSSPFPLHYALYTMRTPVLLSSPPTHSLPSCPRAHVASHVPIPRPPRPKRLPSCRTEQPLIQAWRPRVMSTARYRVSERFTASQAVGSSTRPYACVCISCRSCHPCRSRRFYDHILGAMAAAANVLDWPISVKSLDQYTSPTVCSGRT